MRRLRIVPLAAALLVAPVAHADSWLPHPPKATWTYAWSDSEYNPTKTKEKVTVKSQTGTTFILAWTTDGLSNPASAVTTSGTVSFQETTSGVVNTNWTSSPPPPAFPILCSQQSQCGNSLAGVWFNVIWGTRVPTIAEPLITGTSWSSTGGYKNDVASASDYLGVQTVKVPAFHTPVRAAVIRSEVSQAGAIGDPYGTGTRTVWWVYGVGPVKVLFRHSGGSGAPVTTAELLSTNMKALPPPPDTDYFPLVAGLAGKFQWTDSHFKGAEVQSYKVDQASNGSGRVSISSVSGPIHTKGAYFFTLRTDGFTGLAGTAKAATLAKLPALGPSALPAAKRRHFFTVFDLMTYGFNPVLPAYAQPGTAWTGHPGTSDFDVYGVSGHAKVLGIQKVTVPAGTFEAVAVQSTLKQAGFPWGSGTRTSWFAPGKGLVKLVFQHADGSVSTVVRLK